MAQLSEADTGRTRRDADKSGEMVPGVVGRMVQRFLGG